MKNMFVHLLLLCTWMAMHPGLGLAQSSADPSGLYLQEIQLAREESQRTITLRFSQKPTFVHSFTLPSPARLVIDVGGEIERAASATYTASDALITRVRLGSHPHHARFVLDLKASQLSSFSVEQEDNLITAVLRALNKKVAQTRPPIPAQLIYLYHHQT